ncbi:hypothetical protein PF007_g32605, partial [Phytophthora fragariae]
SHLPALRQLPSEAHKETNDMLKERVRREKQPRGPLQCQYPGRCSNERAINPNGGRHWLCKSHRDHQNALQRDRYKKKLSRPRTNHR